MIFYKRTLSYKKSLLAKDIGTKKSNISKIYQLSKELENNNFELKLLEKYSIDEQLLKKLENKNYVKLLYAIGGGGKLVSTSFNNHDFNYTLCKANTKYNFKNLEEKLDEATGSLNSSDFAKVNNIDKYVADKLFEYFCYKYSKQFLKSNITSNDVNISIV
ncbi:hypothetical protein [Francisella philomiragia]|nr:hypothetical protein [Francisella philomiragia]MBK2278320.1 hypothetical protein [Francisella philomiragia]MBK2287795.1 hypothetical protein [Francisella philomiragia]MBK2290135.1 hypothetical protein [Francisella philomiragia]MBK2307525.1 hypothetical protein [Francisella philomiragia]